MRAHKSAHSGRLRLLSLFILIFALLLIAKLYFVQIVTSERYEVRAEDQYLAGENYFDRGSIFFTDKNGSLVPGASIKTGFILHINPSILSENSNLEETYTKITNITEIDKEEFLAKAKKTSDPYEELARRLQASTAEKIKALKIPGVLVSGERWRAYPGETAAAHVLGLVGYSGDELAGRYGLESLFEPVLKRDAEGIFVNFFAEIFSNIKKVVSEDESLEGDIVTTIEPSVEAFLEREIAKVSQTYSSDFTGGVVIDPNTGEIYAMALTPTFNPNSPQSESGAGVFRNKLVEDRYEMGSILKAVTLAIGLNEGAITARTTYNDPGCITLNTRNFCNYDGKSHGTYISMQTVLSKSLNTGAAHVVSRVGSEKFSKAMLAFGLEETTGIDLP
ncbi:MAG: penicillin-binding transpeptidase domain-containing protein, partial [Patescibacteria group bacterium]